MLLSLVLLSSLHPTISLRLFYRLRSHLNILHFGEILTSSSPVR